jgi:hypothetical protein
VCPVTPRLTLPQHYTQTMMELQHEFLPGKYAWPYEPTGLSCVVRPPRCYGITSVLRMGDQCCRALTVGAAEPLTTLRICWGCHEPSWCTVWLHCQA